MEKVRNLSYEETVAACQLVFDTDKKAYGCGYHSVCMEPTCHMTGCDDHCPLDASERYKFSMITWNSKKLTNYPNIGMM